VGAAERDQAVTIGGRIYIPGGEGQGGAVQTTFEAYDPRGKQWEELPKLPAPRSRYALAGFEGKLYLFGGWDGQQARGEVYQYDPQLKTWSELAAMPTARSNAGAAVVEDRIYVIGGENASGPLSVNERFDPTGSGAGAWESTVPLATPVASPALIATINSVLLFDPQQRNTTEYLPASDAWRQPIEVPTNIDVSSRAAGLGTKIFLFGPAASGMLSEYQATYSTLFPMIENRPQ
jgi:hypothetical protein